MNQGITAIPLLDCPGLKPFGVLLGAKWVWVKIKPPGNGPQVLVLGSIYQGNPFWGYPIEPQPNERTAPWRPSLGSSGQAERLVGDAAKSQGARNPGNTSGGPAERSGRPAKPRICEVLGGSGPVQLGGVKNLAKCLVLGCPCNLKVKLPADLRIWGLPFEGSVLFEDG